jgi:spoIIIJ-associated protein
MVMRILGGPGVRQGENVVAEPDEEQDVPGQLEASADEISAQSEDAVQSENTVQSEATVLPADAAQAADAGDVAGTGAAAGDDDEAGDDEAGDDDEAEDDYEAEDDDEAVGVQAAEDGRVPEPDDGASVADLELESEIAADYIEGLLDVADLDGDIDMDVEGERAFVSVVGATLDELVGQRGEVLEALQELTRLAVHRQTGERTRMMLDVGGYRQRRRTELAETGRDAADEVKRTGEPKRLWAMNPFERKIVHDAVAAAGLRSESEGEEPDRRVVVLPVG